MMEIFEDKKNLYRVLVLLFVVLSVYFAMKFLSEFRSYNMMGSNNVNTISFEIFKSFYARFARNSAIDALAYGGVYIAGGIAQKNSSIFDAKFVKSFEDNPKFRSTLRKIPIYLISENKVGLLGAGFAGAKLFKELKKNF